MKLLYQIKAIELGGTCMYIHTYIHTYVRTYIHTYIQTYRHTDIHTYIHIILYPLTKDGTSLPRPQANGSESLDLLVDAADRVYKSPELCSVGDGYLGGLGG